jgi:uncharacterized protein (DUF983 family)
MTKTRATSAPVDRMVRPDDLVNRAEVSPRRRAGPHFICPDCGGQDWRIIDGEFSAVRNALRRRRECVECGCRKTTWETDDTPARRRGSTWNPHISGGSSK